MKSFLSGALCTKFVRDIFVRDFFLFGDLGFPSLCLVVCHVVGFMEGFDVLPPEVDSCSFLDGGCIFKRGEA